MLYRCVAIDEVERDVQKGKTLHCVYTPTYLLICVRGESLKYVRPRPAGVLSPPPCPCAPPEFSIRGEP